MRISSNLPGTWFRAWKLVKGLKNGVFWDVTQRGSCKNRRFGGTQCFHHQGDKNR
jgi:hypothetical protein